jgi:multiple sugar transport system permease protein
MRGREAVAFYITILPWMIGFVALVAGPFLSAFYFSFTNYDILRPAQWVGLRNYGRMISGDKLFWISLRVTTIYSVGSVVLMVVIALGIAMLMNQRLPGINLFRTIYYMPAVISGVTVAVMWVWLLNPEFGLVNHVLRVFGIQGPMWLFSTRWALVSFILMSAWQAGVYMLIFLAGLQAIPTALYEVAIMDGAGFMRRFLRITLPMLSPVILVNLVISIINTFQGFTNAYVMTGGGPNNATLLYVLHIYRQGFAYFKMGYSSALAWVLFALILLITIGVLRSSAFWVYYAGERD